MAVKSRRDRFFILVIAALAVAGCSPPVGSIGGNISSSKVYDGLRVEFTRTTYTIDEPFRRDHLKVFAITYSGGQEPVTPDFVKVIEDPAKPAQFTIVLANDDYTFQSTGPKDILVEYKTLSLKYPIQVFPTGSEIVQIPSIIIEWAHLKE